MKIEDINSWESLNIEFSKAVSYFYPKGKSISYKQMCKKIAEYEIVTLKATGMPDKNPESIFNYSATGELFNIPLWFVQAYYKALEVNKIEIY